MKKLCSTIGLISFLVLLLTTSCQKKTTGSSKKSPSVPGTIIFLDTSMSMRGYFRPTPAAGTTIQRFILADLLGILAEDNLTPAYLSSFGSAIPAPEVIQSLRRWSFFESQRNVDDIYSQKETNLIGVFENRDFGRSAASIIITDGLQSGIEGSGNNIEGFDTRLFKVIKDKNSSGTYLWLIGVRTEFNGYIYPERPNPQGRRAPFGYPGIRPVYIWIASHDPNIGYTLVMKIITRIRSIAGPLNAVKVTGLTYVPYPTAKIDIDVDASSSPIHSKGLKENNFEWLVSKTQEEIINVPISLNIPEDPLESNLDIEWRTNLKLVPENIRWAKLVNEEGDWGLNLTYSYIPGGGFGCSFSRGELNIVAITNPAIIQRPWWSTWSTDDDSSAENANKTLYLERLAPIITSNLKEEKAGSVLLKIRRP